MPALITALVLSTFMAPLDTAVVLGTRMRDVTGDGKPELLQVVGIGQSIDSLNVTFVIESAGRIVFRRKLAPLTRFVGFDAGRRKLSASEHSARLREFDDWFFAETKFMTPDKFVEWLSTSARHRVSQIPSVLASDRLYQLVSDSLEAAGKPYAEADVRVLQSRRAPPDGRKGAEIWEQMRRDRVTVFRFSEGGDALTAIAWSASDQRFYRLLECC